MAKKPTAKRAATLGAAKADQSTWKKQWLRTHIKFGDKERAVYLKAYAETGAKGTSAKAAGVSMQCVNNHKENDPEFVKACDEAYEQYVNLITAEVKRRGQEGWDEPVYAQGKRVVEPILHKDGSQAKNEEGELLWRYATVRKFSDTLLQMEAKKVDTGYRDRQDITLDTTGTGVMVAPGDMSPEAWKARAEAKNAEKQKPKSEDEVSN